MKRIFFSSLIIICAAHIANAQYMISPLKTTHISIFKNGTYFITKEGEARPDKGLFVVTPPSDALNGTYWLSAGKDNKIKSISVKPDVTRINRPVQSIAEFIQSSTGKNITIVLPPVATNGTAREIKGTVLSYIAATQLVKMKTADGRVMICNVENAQEAYGDAGSGESFQQDSIVRMAKVQLENNPSKVNVSTLSLQTGMSWTPSYFLKLTDDNTARLDLKATILNTDDEAIKDASVDLVIGNPQMFYGAKLDDISTDFLNRQIYHSEPRMQLNASYLNNAMMQVQSNGAERDEEAAVEMPIYSADGEKTNDLYYFNLGKLNIEEKSKTIVPLQTTEVTYDDLYELYADDQTNYWSNERVINDPERVIPIFHILKIKNTGTAPFTTGPIFVVDKNEKPLAQDEIKYTATGASVKINLSKALDLNAKNTEDVINTSYEKRILNNHQYTVARISGKLSVTNYQSKAVKVNISKTLTGKVLSAGDGKAESSYRNNSDNNKNLISAIKWEKQIPAKGTVEVSYQYEVLVF
jgi:hypothetical protein